MQANARARGSPLTPLYAQHSGQRTLSHRADSTAAHATRRARAAPGPLAERVCHHARGTWRWRGGQPGGRRYPPPGPRGAAAASAAPGATTSWAAAAARLAAARLAAASEPSGFAMYFSR